MVVTASGASHTRDGGRVEVSKMVFSFKESQDPGKSTTGALHTAIIFQLNYRSTDMNTTAFLCSNST